MPLIHATIPSLMKKMRSAMAHVTPWCGTALKNLWHVIRNLSGLAVLLGIVLGAIVHLVSIFIIPVLSQNSAYHRLMRVSAPYATVLISSSSPLEDDPYTDPMLVRSACHFDLSQGPVRVSLPISTLIVQSISVHGERGGVLYAVPDRAAANGVLSVLIMSERDQDELSLQEDEETTQREVRLALPVARAFVLTRAISPFLSLKEKAEEAASQLTCTSSPLK
jgi:uncharacterized membrane protein